MSGVEIVGELLGGSGPMLAVVPADRMRGGGLPPNITLPALLLRTVSVVKSHALRGAANRAVERVQVTVRANNYAQQKAVTKLVEQACDGRSGTIAGYADVDVTAAGVGPDFEDDQASIWMSSIDFRVSFRPA